MASTKKNTKKQDEKHLKILRELCSLPHNKKCFDCGQRGPTYVNMTIGSFVCTSCSGILRGLNPQHRVKSISMTSFTATEIEFLQNAGNEVCRRSWLGLWNSPNPPEPESRDEIKVKDFMMQKYDRKTWYIPPSQLPPASPKSEASQPLPERKPLKHLLGEGSPTLVVGQEARAAPRPSANVPSTVPPPIAQQPPKQPANDLLGDLGGDPFAQTAAPAGFNAFGNQPVAPASSGGFDIFASPQSQQQQPVQQQQQQQQQFGGFDAFGGNPQQSAGGFNAFSSGGAVQQQHTQPQAFNAFGSQLQKPQQQQQQQQGGGFSPFASSPPKAQQQGGFSAFGNTQTQQQQTNQSSFGAFGNPPAPTASSFDAFGSFSAPASQQTKTTSTVGNFGPITSTSAAGTPASSGSNLATTGDRYAALSDLDSIFKVQTSTPSVGQQGSVFSSSSNTGNSLGMSGMSGLSTGPSTGLPTSSSAMPSGPNPFASAGNTALPAQSNPFQSSTGGMAQTNGFSGGNAGFGAAPQSSAQSLNFAGAGMTAMAANQFGKMGGTQPGLFGNPGGANPMQSAGFNTGQGQVSAGGQFGGSQLGTSQVGNTQFGASQFGSSQFGGSQLPGSQLPGSQLPGSQFPGSQLPGSQFPGSQFGGIQGGQMSGGQFNAGQFGGATMQQPQQQAFGGAPAGMGTNQFGQLQQQQQPQQQFGGGWQQKPQSNPFMAGGLGGGLPTQQRQSTNPFM